jgi:hypothetical protein
MNESEWSGGFDALMERALETHGDLARILELEPPADVSPDWRSGFGAGRMSLVDVLLPDGEELSSWLATHEPDSLSQPNRPHC